MSQSAFYRGLEIAQQAMAQVPTSAAGQAAQVHTALAAPLANTTPNAPAACRAGCAACCHLPVGLYFGEALRLRAALEHQPALRAEVASAAAATATLPWRALAGQPCPLLRNGLCAVHPARPLACRALASSDAAACARGVAGTGDVPIDDAAFWLGQGGAAALAAAQPAGPRELRSALHALLHNTPHDAAALAAFAAARPTH